MQALYLRHIPRVSHAFYANNRRGGHNGWPYFRSLVTRHIIENRERPWRLEYERPFISLNANPYSKMHNLYEHVVMTGTHVQMLLRRTGTSSAYSNLTVTVNHL